MLSDSARYYGLGASQAFSHKNELGKPWKTHGFRGYSTYQCPPSVIGQVVFQRAAAKWLKGGRQLNIQTATALVQRVFCAALQPGDHPSHILWHFLSHQDQQAQALADDRNH